MEFCPKCGAVLIDKRKNSGCPRCNYSSKNKIKIKTSEKIENKNPVYVVKEKDSQVMPIVDGDCVKCGNQKVYFWTLQTRSSDESETKFFKCTNSKCEHTWREYR